MVRINDVFWTIQGEGLNSGRRSLFVRMPKCNLRCPWCDTEFLSSKEWTETQFKEFANQEKARFAVLTGGEPMANEQSNVVIKWLKDLNFEIATETNGTMPILDGVDFVCVSPKREADYEINDNAWRKANEFKYIVDFGFDWRKLKRHKHDSAALWLSPEFGRMKERVEEIERYTRIDPRWRLNLQTHKWVGIK